MSKLFYPKLAATNIKKNGKFYFPYILTCIATTSMFYIMCSVAFNKTIGAIHEQLKVILYMGIWVIGLFAIIFLFYTNSFLMKRRKKEFGLYNILGMEKRHIAKILCFETMDVFFIGIVAGIGCGILFSKLVVMLLDKILEFETGIDFEVPIKAVISTIVLLVGIFFLTLIANMAKIQLSKPIELLHGGNVGEKEPKTKLFLAIIGFLCLAVGYYIAITTESPLSALALFFVAVILVIIGTYCLFTAGSIAMLKILKKNKKYYYKTKHFTTISGMIYRMKQNAVGLGNICILSTMVLVTVSTTVCLYLGIDDMVDSIYKHDITVWQNQSSDTANDNSIYDEVNSVLEKENIDVTFMNSYKYLSFFTGKDGNEFTFNKHNYSADNAHILYFMTQEQYNQLSDDSISLSNNDVAVYNDGKEDLTEDFTIGDTQYNVTKLLDSFPNIADNYFNNFRMNSHFIVVSNYDVLSHIYDIQLKNFGEENSSSIRYCINIDFNADDNAIIDCYNSLSDDVTAWSIIDCKQQWSQESYTMYGGFLFLGIFLGMMFMMATVLIIYYKQISEGYDDKSRFEIMQKVGMSQIEVKKSIRSQVLTVFFLPLITAGIHITAAFKMIYRLLTLFGLTNIDLFAWCTLGTVGIFAVAYGLIYSLTARVYYKIVD